MKHFLFIAIVLLGSCDKDCLDGTVLDTDVEIFLEDAEGNNLLNEETPNGINFDDIELSYIVDGEARKVYDSNLDYPRNMVLNEQEGRTWLRVFANMAQEEEYPVSLIHWGNGDTDTLRCHYYRDLESCETAHIIDSVWFNGVLRFPPPSELPGFYRAFTVVK